MRRAFFGILITIFSSSFAAAQDVEPRDLGAIDDKDLDEVSGCAPSRRNPGVLWVHNDGDTKWIHAVKTTGQVVARVRLPVDVEDVEDIAIGPGADGKTDCLYVGDIGDNDRERDSIRVLRFPEPSLDEQGSDIDVPYVELFSLTYPDRKHDAETLMVDPIAGMVLIVTKDGAEARIYGFPTDPESARDTRLRALGRVAVHSVSAGDVSRDGGRVILRREDRGWFWTRQAGQSLAEAMTGRSRVLPVRTARQGKNGEAIGFAPDGSGYYTISEGKSETISVFGSP